MRLTIFLILIGISNVFANSTYSQNTKFSFRLRNISLEQLFEEIQNQSEFNIFYKDNQVDINRKVSVTASEASVEEILGQALEGTRLEFKVIDKQVVIYPSKTTYGNEGELDKFRKELPQQKDISGKVTDSEGQPLPGVTVIVKGTTRGNVTDTDGNYTLTNVPENATLIFSFVGMKMQEIPIAGQTAINVTMEEESVGIEEVIAVGYGTMRKIDITGSVSSVSSDDITKSKSTSFLGGIQGKISGVRLSSTSGEPGAASNISIRGANSIYASAQPLFVIDGIPIDIDTDEVSDASVGYSTGYDPMSSINPSDIESIEILKDASATAIYGSRGANGVILVTTKSGNAGSLKMDYDGYCGISVLSKKLEVLSADEYIDYRAEVSPESVLFYYDSNNDGEYNELDKKKDPYSFPSHDWQDEILRTAITQSHSLSISGGSKKTSYSGSAGYLNQEGIVLNNDYQRYNARLRLDHQQNEKLRVGLNLNTSYSELNGATQSGGGTGIFNGIVQNLIVSRPIELYVPSWDIDGKYISPLSMIEDADKSTSYTRNYLSGYLEYKPFKDLVFKTSVGGSLSSSKGKEYYGSNTAWGNLYNGRAILQDRKTVSWFNTNSLTYHKKFKKQSFTAMGAFEVNNYNFESFKVANSDYADETTGVDDISKGAVLTSVGSNRWETNRLSYLGRINYSILNRYLFTASFRVDGSDKFGEDNRYGYFPSFAFAWRVTEEQFLKSTEWLNNLKLRLSYGATGNERIPAYQYTSSMSNTYYNGDLGLSPSSRANPDLKWETTIQYNAGIDVALFQNRIEFNVDYYIKQTKDMLLNAYVSSQSGYNTQWRNVGRVDNKGVEFQLTTRNIQTKTFSWTTDFSITRNVNTIKDLGNVDYISVTMSGGWITNVGRVMEGEALGTAYGYKFDGVYQIDDFTWNNDSDPTIEHSKRTYTLKEDVIGVDGVNLKPGSFKFKDLNDDSIIDDLDKTIISHSSPKHFGGLTNTFRYKNFELSTFFEWSYGNEIFNESRWRLEGGVASTWMNISRDFWYNRWTPENPTNKYGTFSEDTKNKTSLYASSYYVEDASWLRLKNLSFSYNLEKRFTKKLGVSNVRIYFVGNNLITWTKYTGFDPEISSNNSLLPGFDRISYPRSKSYILGVNISF